jgi:hypothetical protein
MNTSPYPGFHFIQRLEERFPDKVGKLELESYERITRITSNRYDHPKIMGYFNELKDRAEVYLVSKENNIIIPTTLNGKMKTVLYYTGHP